MSAQPIIPLTRPLGIDDQRASDALACGGLRTHLLSRSSGATETMPGRHDGADRLIAQVGKFGYRQRDVAIGQDRHGLAFVQDRDRPAVVVSKNHHRFQDAAESRASAGAAVITSAAVNYSRAICSSHVVHQSYPLEGAMRLLSRGARNKVIEYQRSTSRTRLQLEES